MLKADISIKKQFSLYTNPALPGGPDKAICIEVSFVNAFRLVLAWCDVHLWDRYRADRVKNIIKLVAAAAVLAAIVCLIAAAQLNPQETFGRMPSADSEQTQATAEANPSAANPQEKKASKQSRSWRDVLNAPQLTWGNYWARTISIALGLPLLILGLMSRFFSGRLICRIYLLVLKPHQPFPVIDKQLARADDVHVFAVRALGRDVRERFFKLYDDPLLATQRFETTSLQVTHQHCSVIDPPSSRIDLLSFWSLIRFAVGMMLPPWAGSTARAMYFTYKQHETLVFAYVCLLGIALLLPAMGWVASAESTQFPLVMSGLGIIWALFGMSAHRAKSGHLAEWERLTLDYPFRGCPLYRYSDDDDQRGYWELLHIDDFRKPIRDFGLDYSTAQQFVLGIMLLSYFAVLALVK